MANNHAYDERTKLVTWIRELWDYGYPISEIAEEIEHSEAFVRVILDGIWKIETIKIRSLPK